MSAEVLRKAAALMRNRAVAASGSPWRWAEQSDADWIGIQDDFSALGLMHTPADAFHVTSWHPAVALAVADWLDHDAEVWEQYALQGKGLPFARRERSLTVAATYLGDS